MNRAKRLIISLIVAFGLLLVVLVLQYQPKPALIQTAQQSAQQATAYPLPVRSPVPTIRPLPTVAPTLIVPTVPPTPTLPPSTPGPVIWLTYSDPDAGYTFLYPSDAHLGVSKDVDFRFKAVNLAFNLPQIHDYQGLSIRVLEKTPDTSVEQFLEQAYTQATGQPPPPDFRSSFQYGVVSGIQSVQTNQIPSNADYAIYVPNRGRVYRIALVHGLASLTSSPEAASLLNQIVQTFVLTP
ncbi:MAG: hypothetical protein HY259_10010 [Chloroflexi bacterium]|nr:hypothetical protein [Chloroflexota bacterium]MBI3733772.1 hypothetical protein [Chloroflexota bacterium]